MGYTQPPSLSHVHAVTVQHVINTIVNSSMSFAMRDCCARSLLFGVRVRVLLLVVFVGLSVVTSSTSWMVDFTCLTHVTTWM